MCEINLIVNTNKPS